MEKQQLYQELIGLIAPRTVTENFELIKIIEKPTSITLYFEEKEEKIPDELKGKEVVQDGYLNKMELQTFPLKDKTVYIALRRRRWKEKGNTKESYSNRYDLHFKGMKTTREFGIFLKEELGWQPDEYNQFWQSLAD